MKEQIAELQSRLADVNGVLSEIRETRANVEVELARVTKDAEGSTVEERKRVERLESILEDVSGRKVKEWDKIRYVLPLIPLSQRTFEQKKEDVQKMRQHLEDVLKEKASVTEQLNDFSSEMASIIEDERTRLAKVRSSSLVLVNSQTFVAQSQSA